MVVALVLLPVFAEMLGGRPDPHSSGANNATVLMTLGITILKVAGFIAIVVVLGPKIVPWLLKQVARTGSRELFTLSVLAVALGIAYGSAELFGVSFALGAFFAGVVLSESDFSHRAAADSLPMQDAHRDGVDRLSQFGANWRVFFHSCRAGQNAGPIVR